MKRITEAVQQLMSIGCKAAIAEGQFRDDWLKAVEEMRGALAAREQEAIADAVVRLVGEMDDRNSPKDWPEAKNKAAMVQSVAAPLETGEGDAHG